MNQQPCENYSEWMSLAQDGMLNSTQSHLLHTHLAACPPCQAQWEAMTLISQMFHAAPMVTPIPGFAARFQARVAYRREQRRQALILVLLSVGVIAIAILSLPSLFGVLSFAGQLILPYRIITYIQGLFDWVYIVLSALADAAWVLIRHFATTPAGLAFIGSVAVAGALVLVWTRLLVGRLATQRTK
jgi:predicted anti-sigma-YlaC factor YlaD